MRDPSDRYSLIGTTGSVNDNGTDRLDRPYKGYVWACYYTPSDEVECFERSALSISCVILTPRLSEQAESRRLRFTGESQ